MANSLKIFHGFDRKFIKGDIYGGVTAGIIALPLGLAWGAVSGLGPLAGIYSSIIVGFLAALFGGTPGQISGPTGPMVVIIAAAFLEFKDQPEIVFFCVTFSGIILLIFFDTKKRISSPIDPIKSAWPFTFAIFCKFVSALITCGFAPRPNKIVS